MGVYAGIMAAVTNTHYGCTPRPYSRPNNSEYDDGNNRENSNNIALHTWSEGKKKHSNNNKFRSHGFNNTNKKNSIAFDSKPYNFGIIHYALVLLTINGKWPIRRTDRRTDGVEQRTLCENAMQSGLGSLNIY